MRHRTWMAAGAVLIALALGMSLGCKKKDSCCSAKQGDSAKAAKVDKASKSAQPAIPAENQNISLAFVTNNPSEFWTIARRGVDQAVAELGVKVDFRIPANGQAAEQQQIVEDLIAKGCQGMAISPVDPANQTEMINRAGQAMKVICHDSDAPDSTRLAYIGTNNYTAGREAGKLIKEALPDGGKIMIFVGTLDAQNARDRRQGILDELQGSEVEVIDTRTDNTDRTRAKANVEDTIVNHSDVACLVGLWSYNGPAICQAVVEAGKTGKIKVVCFDEEDATLQGVKDGVIYATVVQKPYQFGYQSVKVLTSLVKGETAVIPENKLIDTGVTLVKQDNVDSFWTELKGLTGRP